MKEFKNYRVYSNTNGTARIESKVDDEKRRAQAEERLASIGGEVHGKDGRTKSLATRPALDTMKILEDAIKMCANPIKLSWKNVCFEVEVLQNEEEFKKDGHKTRRQMIVKEATGYAAPGIATYIMGASGAGKTSLLNILSDRVVMINKAKLSGNITFNDDIPLN